jgi:fatty acid desaturase
MTMHERWSKPVQWYRTPLPAEKLKQLHERSDFLGALQTFGYLGLLVVTGGLAFYSTGRWPWWATVLLTFLHGTCFAFQINAVHELGHGTVFRTKWLNPFFEHVFAFLGRINHRVFDVSHVRHHQFTLHPPDDLEVVLPYQFAIQSIYKTGLFNWRHFRQVVKSVVPMWNPQFRGEWERALFPESNPAKRRTALIWSRVIVAGHATILVGAVIAAILVHPRYLMIPLLTTFAGAYGTWVQQAVNATQHIGLQDNVPDFRLCCRTIILNPIVRFLYWHMNYHTEHHMYAAVPCYKLGRLHQAIRHDLPPCPVGIMATWREIAAIQKIQETNPQYQHVAALPAGQA